MYVNCNLNVNGLISGSIKTSSIILDEAKKINANLININSNAATEAVWAGIPVITLDQHVTNPVTSNSISNINDLYRPNLAQWLCMLSYSQFTYEELIDGSFLKIVKRYHV